MRSKNQDLTQLMAAWEYDEAHTVRRIKANDGREVLQVRLPLGVEQYELDGRPDGKRPMKHESWLHYYLQRARSAAAQSQKLTLVPEDISRLHQEGLLYYHRYLLFFQVREYRLCARDTRRNLRLLDFVATHAPDGESEPLEQYRAYIIRMNAMARALLRVQEKEDVRGALRILYTGVKDVHGLPPIANNHVSEFEKARSVKCLEDLISQLEVHVPRTVALRQEMQKAILEENYERAALLRDEIAGAKRRRGKDLKASEP